MAIREEIRFTGRDDTRQAMRSLERGLSNVNRQAGDVALRLAGIGTAAAASLGLVIKKSVDLADEIAKTAKVVGVGAEALQELRFAAQQSGIESRGLDDSLRRLGRRAGEFANSGAGPAQKAIEGLKLEMRDGAGQIKSTEQIFYDVVDALQGVESDAQKAAYAAQLFGDDFGPKLVPLINQGRSGINAYREEIRGLGGVISGELLENAEELADKMNILNTQLRTKVASIVLENADAISQLATAAVTAASAVSGFVVEFGNALGYMAARAAGYRDIVDVQERIAVLQERIANPDIWGPFTFNVQAAKRELAELQEIVAAVGSFTPSARPATQAPPIVVPGVSTPTGSAGGGGEDAEAKRKRELVAKIISEAETDFQAYVRRLNEAYELMQEGLLNEEAYNAYVLKLEEVFNDGEEVVKDSMNQMSAFADEAARNMQSAFADFLFDPFENGLDGMLKGFVDTMRRMAAEIASQAILRSLFSGFEGKGGLGGAIFDSIAGKRAMGGPVSGGKSYLVGENGPEIVRMGGSGYVVPNHAMGGGVTVQIDARGSDNPERLLELIPVIKNSIKAEIYSDKRRGIYG